MFNAHGYFLTVELCFSWSHGILCHFNLCGAIFVIQNYFIGVNVLCEKRIISNDVAV